MKATFAYWGNYTIAFNAIFQKLGVDFIPPKRTNQEAIKEGARLSPEMYCFPLKANIGNYLEAIRRGADTIFMVTNLGGSCRLRYYSDIQKKSLKDAGYDIDFVTFDQSPWDIYLKIKEMSKASFWKIIEALWFFELKLRLIEGLEKKANYLRPREIKKGETDEIIKSFLPNIDKADSGRKIRKLKKEIKEKLSKIGIDKNKIVPKVGIIGEIFTVSDDSINFEIEKKLGNEGIEVHREMDITYHLKKKIFPWKDWNMQRKIIPYLKSTVGGHGRDAIYEMLEYVKKDFDGIVHLLPLNCMPESTVRPILQKIHFESNIPLLSLSLDEEVGEAGIITRIEAFADVVKNYYGKKSKR